MALNLDMNEKILATFRIEPDKWKQFKSKTGDVGFSASAMLLDFIDSYLAGNELPKRGETYPDPASNLDNLEFFLDERVQACIDLKLESFDNSYRETIQRLYERLERAEEALLGVATLRAENETLRQERVSIPNRDLYRTTAPAIDTITHSPQLDVSHENENCYDPSEQLTTAVVATDVSSPDLKAIRDRALASLKLGKQAPGYKAAAKALDQFIAELGSGH